jgi:hypothetical protein
MKAIEVYYMVQVWQDYKLIHDLNFQKKSQVIHFLMWFGAYNCPLMEIKIV